MINWELSIRADILRRLVKFDLPYKNLIQELDKIWWYDVALISLRAGDIESVLLRYINNEYWLSDIENWANLIEGRDDIEYNQKLWEIICELANPILYGGLNLKRIEQILEILRKQS